MTMHQPDLTEPPLPPPSPPPPREPNPPPPQGPSESQFSIKRGLIHGGILFAVAVRLAAIVGASLAEGSEESRKAGEATGPYALLAFGAGIGVSAVHQSGRKLLGWALDAVVVVMVIAAAASYFD
jgi:hypothetical protein